MSLPGTRQMRETGEFEARLVDQSRTLDYRLRFGVETQTQTFEIGQSAWPDRLVATDVLMALQAYQHMRTLDDQYRRRPGLARTDGQRLMREPGHHTVR